MVGYHKVSKDQITLPQPRATLVDANDDTELDTENQAESSLLL